MFFRHFYAGFFYILLAIYPEMLYNKCIIIER